MKDTLFKDFWDGQKSVFIKSFWGWSPETWGKVGFSNASRRDTIVHETSDPFIMVVYVTKNARHAEIRLRGKIVGFYLVSHIEGHRDEFTHPDQYSNNPDKWQYSLKALRAFRFVQEYRLNIDDFDSSINDRAQALGQWSEELHADRIEKLKYLPFVEEPIYGGPSFVDQTMHIPKTMRHKVRGGPVNRSGYFVNGEPFNTEKGLYALMLEGDTTAFLGEPAVGKNIYKIGLSFSPESRLDAFRKAIPFGAFQWVLYKSTWLDNNHPYPNFEAAVAGENAMKDYLGRHGQWLGSEFYAATNEHLENAWRMGRETALQYSKDGKGVR